ncbi:CvpA family protein [Nitratifractor sp.]
MPVPTLNSLDLIVGALVLLLAFKGVFNGFRRELISLIAIVGGVFVASRTAVPLARWTEAHLFRLNNPAFMDLVAFLLLLLAVWGTVTLLGRIAGPTGVGSASTLERILGYLVAAVKYFLILSIIVAALFQTRLVREKFSRQSRSSLLYPLLQKSGAFLIHLPASSIRARTPKSGK